MQAMSSMVRALFRYGHQKVTEVVYTYLYNNVTSVGIFIGCWPWSIKGHTHRWCQIHLRSRQQTCFSFSYTCRKNPSINHLNFYCIKQIDTFSRVHVYCNKSQKTSQRVKNNSHATRLRLVLYFFVLYTLWRHLWSITVHTHGKMLSICYHSTRWLEQTHC